MKRSTKVTVYISNVQETFEIVWELRRALEGTKSLVHACVKLFFLTKVTIDFGKLFHVELKSVGIINLSLLVSDLFQLKNDKNGIVDIFELEYLSNLT